MITSSQIESDSVQADGRRYITELHFDDKRGVLRFTYLGSSDVDAAAVMAARVLQYNNNEILYTFTVKHEDGTTTDL
jgi:hypothetical protein